MGTRILSNIILIILLFASCSKDNPKPILNVNKTAIDFGEVIQGEIVNETFKISNSGDGDLLWSSSVDQTWVSLNSTSGSVGASDAEITVTIDTSPLGIGKNTCTITITSTSGDVKGSPADIVVSVTVTEILIPGHALTEDETWSGTITLLGDIVIPNGITLTIEPGTIIKVSTDNPDWDEGFEDGNIDIYSRGNIIANGTMDNIIVFTPDSEDPQVGDWWGIGLSTDSSIDLKYCCIAFAENGLFIFGGNSSSVIENCMFAFTEGVADFGPDANLSYNTFIYGGDGYARYGESKTTSLSYCDFISNAWWDVSAFESYNDITIDQSNFINGGDYNLYIGDYFSPIDVVITANNSYGITLTEDNGSGTITVNNPSADPILNAGCGFELIDLPVKSTSVKHTKASSKDFWKKKERIKNYSERDMNYTW